MGLIAGGRERGAIAQKGVDYLIATQAATGGWNEAAFTGTGFPGDFYINYGLYRDVFPPMALARYQKALRSRKH